MKKGIVIFILLTIVSQEFILTAQTSKLKVIKLTGSAYERGYQHGEILKDEINQTITKWKSAEQKRYKQDIDSLISVFINSTKLYDAVKKYTPELLNEIKGISDGSGIELDIIMGFQISEEMGTFGGDVFAHHCTSIGFKNSETNPTIIAQNLDVPPFLHGNPVLLHIIDSNRDLEQFIYTFPGHIGAIGMNNKGLGLTANAIPQVNHSIFGLPVAFIIRGFLNKSTFMEGRRFIMETNHSTGQNYLIGGLTDIISLECSANQKSAFKPLDNSNFTYHTNHPLANDDISQEFKNEAQKEGQVYDSTYQFKCSRFDYLELNVNHSLANIDSIKRILSIRENGINNWMNYGCCIMILSKSPELHIAAGRPDKTEFRIFKFEE